ncbi:MAG: AI-2E family transporter [Chloroflexi bacterium]|jgi:predicted PurR-regulated permease PerM|nr:AI-2E family transporter [Chloroflexota bacterium]MBT3671319.1 AI-2E family transporter [Chloroflexota bacterium]MBT4002074.1 AI-2E family transporter [Chloroflexota bacterium]MBT4304222.1 AI-2E family transporter [Chloroflexota bacterium]MBT4534241.1 AI-2E family transporter [Chloroflexota bacterium]
MSNVWSNSLRYRIMTALVILFLALAYYAREAFGPLIFAALIAYLMNPIVEWIAKSPRLSRKVGVNIVFFLVIAILIAIPSIFLPSIIRELETFSQELRSIYAILLEFLSTPIQILEWTFEPQVLLPAIEDIPLLDVSYLTGEAFHLVEVITVNILWLLVILVATYFLLLDWTKIKRFFTKLTPEEYQSDAQRLYREVVTIWNSYLRGNLILMFFTAIIFMVAWSIIGLPAGILLGLMMGLLKIIPDVGPMFAAGASVLVAFIEGSTVLDIPNMWFAVLVFVVYFVLINIITIWLRSVLFGRSVHMHSGLVFILIMLAVIIQGILGAVIVIPFVASSFIILQYVLRKIYKQPGFPEEMDVVEELLSD